MPRPREFDTGKALTDMTRLFWEHGYEGTSMFEIERATGLRKQSLYRAFGDKRGMYLAALRAYERDEIAESARLLGKPGDAAARFGRLFRHIVDCAVNDGDRRGCFLCNASVDQATLDAATGALVTEMMIRIEETFTATLVAANHRNGDPDTCRTSARGLMAGYFGLRVLIKAGRAWEALDDAARQIIAGLGIETDRSPNSPNENSGP
jgi:TetR/AcrR family transcriptional repressor of nem operon